MKTARLSIITENQNSVEKAKKVAEIISEILKIDGNFNISKYEKFKNSYKIDFVFNLIDTFNSIIESLEKTDRLCSPWIVKLIKEHNDVELTFNKSPSSIFSKNELNVILWALWEVDN